MRTLFSQITPRSRLLEFFANWRVVAGVGQPRRLATKARPENVKYADIPKGRLPARGLLYSFLAHEIAIFAILTVTTAVQLAAEYRRAQQIWTPKEEKLTYLLPELGGGSPASDPAPSKPANKPLERADRRPAPTAAKPGLVYPGPQPIVSNPPNPTNRIQTILQPELSKPPTLQVPLALPNMVTIARLTAPRPTYVPRVAPPAPTAVKTPSAPQLAPELHMKGWYLVTETPAPSPVAPQLSLPALTAQKFTPLPENPHPVIKVPNVPQPTSSAAPEAPQLKATLLAKLETPPEIQDRATYVPKMAQPGARPAPQTPQLQPELGGGTDEHSLLVLSPTPGPPTPNLVVPPGEARGLFAISPEPNLDAPHGSASGSGTGQGTHTAASLGSGEAKVGASSAATTNPEANGNGSGSGDSSSSGKGSAGGTGGSTGGVGAGTVSGTGSGAGSGLGSGTVKGSGSGTGVGSGSGTGSGAGTGPGANPFAGMTIIGGTGSGTAPLTALPDVTKSAKPTSYGMNIVATASSGGGLRDYGVFSNQMVYTVYVPMTHSPEPAPSWTLQYAALGRPAPDPAVSAITLSTSSDQQSPLLPPYPIDRKQPKFPSEIVARNEGRMVVVTGTITTAGKFSQLRIIETPNPLLNQPALEALAKWMFMPAVRNGQAVAVKILLGIPLSLPPK